MKTTSNCSFSKIPLLSYRNIERRFFNTRFKKAANTPHSLNSHIGSRKTTGPENDISFSRLTFFPSSCGSERKKERLPLFRSRRSFGIIQFYFISRISSSLTSSVGSPLASSLFRKDSMAVVSNRRSQGKRTRTRSRFLRPNMAPPQQ